MWPRSRPPARARRRAAASGIRTASSDLNVGRLASTTGPSTSRCCDSAAVGLRGSPPSVGARTAADGSGSSRQGGERRPRPRSPAPRRPAPVGSAGGRQPDRDHHEDHRVGEGVVVVVRAGRRRPSPGSRHRRPARRPSTPGRAPASARPSARSSPGLLPCRVDDGAARRLAARRPPPQPAPPDGEPDDEPGDEDRRQRSLGDQAGQRPAERRAGRRSGAAPVATSLADPAATREERDRRPQLGEVVPSSWIGERDVAQEAERKPAERGAPDRAAPGPSPRRRRRTMSATRSPAIDRRQDAPRTWQCIVTMPPAPATTHQRGPAARPGPPRRGEGDRARQGDQVRVPDEVDSRPRSTTPP